MARFDSPDELRAYLDTFAARGHRQLDTARIYPAHAPGTAEPRIGAVAAGDTFSIDTKFNSFTPGSHSKQNILKNIDESLEALGVKQINIEYLHGADRTTDFAEACEAMDQAFKEGKIRHWGLCKHTADEVQRMIDICEERGLIKPSVYQGQYNPVVRGCEKELLSVLRRNGMAFYAYSPAAAGFFAGNHKNIKPGGRYDQSVRAHTLFESPYFFVCFFETNNDIRLCAAALSRRPVLTNVSEAVHHGRHRQGAGSGIQARNRRPRCRAQMDGSSRRARKRTW